MGPEPSFGHPIMIRISPTILAGFFVTLLSISLHLNFFLYMHYMERAKIDERGQQEAISFGAPPPERRTQEVVEEANILVVDAEKSASGFYVKEDPKTTPKKWKFVICTRVL